MRCWQGPWPSLCPLLLSLSQPAHHFRASTPLIIAVPSVALPEPTSTSVHTRQNQPSIRTHPSRKSDWMRCLVKALRAAAHSSTVAPAGRPRLLAISERSSESLCMVGVAQRAGGSVRQHVWRQYRDFRWECPVLRPHLCSHSSIHPSIIHPSIVYRQGAAARPASSTPAEATT